MTKRQSRENGQAVVEYLLVLVVTVAIVLGLLVQFNQAFRVFAQAFFGDYVLCLLDTGELPILSGDNPSSGECQVAPFQFNAQATADQNGLGVDSANGSGGAGGAGGANGGANGQNNNGKNTGSTQVGAGSSTSSAESTGRSSAYVRATNSNFGRRSGGSGRGGKRVAANDGEAEPASTASTGKLESKSGNRRDNDEKKVAFGKNEGLFGSYGFDSEDTPESGKKLPLSVSKKDQDQRQLKPKRMEVAPPSRKTASVSGSDDSFTFGDWLRYLLIAAILIILFIFIGGQAMTAMKSIEKE